MQVLFLGVGEACGPAGPNTSILVKGRNERKVLLLDCGFTTPYQYYAMQCVMSSCQKNMAVPTDLGIIVLTSFAENPTLFSVL
jgi:ribonuclease BN (tRNA processing enzyme)